MDRLNVSSIFFLIVLLLSLSSVNAAVIYSFTYEINEDSQYWILVEHQPAGDWRFYYPKSQFTKEEVQQKLEQRKAAMDKELKTLADQGRPVTDDATTKTRVSLPLDVETAKYEFVETGGLDADNILQVIEGESLLVYVVILAMAMITMAMIGIKSWFGYVIGIALVTAITWIFTGGVPLLIPAALIIILFVMHSLGVEQ